MNATNILNTLENQLSFHWLPGSLGSVKVHGLTGLDEFNMGSCDAVLGQWISWDLWSVHLTALVTSAQGSALRVRGL